MRKQVSISLSLLLLAAFAAAPPQSAADDRAPKEIVTTPAEAVDRIIAREKQLAKDLKKYHPLVETYIQNLTPDKELGLVPKNDEYFLGKLDMSNGIRTESMLSSGSAPANVMSTFKQPFSGRMKFVLDGFASMALVDSYSLDHDRYDFRYIGREFLGEVRCLVFEVRPRGDANRFSGRIWANDRDFTIVRFNGINGKSGGLFSSHYYFHFDSWRINSGPGKWVPAYIFSEESDLSYGPAKLRKLRFKAQTRIWGYDLDSAGRQGEFTGIEIDQPEVRDDTKVEAISPVMSQRAWERQAEDNLLDRLERAGLLAPAGEVDKVLQTVVNNLVVTNNLNMQTDVRCRVLVTSPMESFTLGHTIVLSRGLIDVLPDEASLATMLAHELGHIALGHQLVDTQYSFFDRTMIGDLELLRSFSFSRSQEEEAAADKRGVELLKNSPYADKIATAGLFLRSLAANSKRLPNLIQSHLGDRLAKGDKVRYTELLNSSAELKPASTTQIAALPLGGRIRMEPWDGRLELIKNKPVALVSAREKMPFEVTPFRLYLTYEPGSATLEPIQTSTGVRPR
jgi:hypothetical protein